MAAVVIKTSGDYCLSPCKNRTGNFNPRRNNNNSGLLISHPSANFSPAMTFHGGGGGGLLCAPPVFLSPYAFQPSISVFRPPQKHLNQPPLLPLPVNQNHRSSSNRKIKNSRSRDQSLTPKKSKNQKHDSNAEKKATVAVVNTVRAPVQEKCLVIKSINPIGPDPKELPRALSVCKDNNDNTSNDDDDDVFVDKFSGSVVFTLSPPPSSLPLPTFSLRPKLSCSVQAVDGVDAGATDSLRRLLRLP